MKLQKSFINNFTHELKTPIASLKLYLDTFNRHEMAREQQLKFIHYMQKDVERLSSNVQMILNVGVLENLKKDYSFETVSLKDYLKRFFHDNEHLFKDFEIKFFFDTSYLFELEINKELFEMLLMNLITNAMKYSLQKKRIDIGLSMRLGRVQLSIRDYGIGIDKKYEKKIFDKFFRIERQQLERQQQKGTGLGLYLCWQVARIHGAKIKAKGYGQNQGCSFTLTFPLQKKFQKNGQ